MTYKIKQIIYISLQFQYSIDFKNLKIKLKLVYYSGYNLMDGWR